MRVYYVVAGVVRVGIVVGYVTVMVSVVEYDVVDYTDDRKRPRNDDEDEGIKEE